MKKLLKIFGIVLVVFTLILNFSSVSFAKAKSANTVLYEYREYPLVRNNVKLHLDRMEVSGMHPKKNILLIHGVTYSSQEFDINYKDYSLARALARGGYAVWSLDIAGYGRSEAVTDGFLPDSDYAAEDINAAVEKIIQITGQDKIDLLGWSWGTVTTSKYASKHPERLNKLVLYAPILSGIGKFDVKEPFHHNTWEHAAEDFQRDKIGKIDYTITDPIVVELWCSKCWRYDKDTSPNGGRCDICVDKSQKLIDLSLLKTPTLIIHGDKDPYLNYKLIKSARLPKSSSKKIIKGGSHVVFIEKPYYKDFQNMLVKFLNQ
ncbi:MAG: alpha/beta hydrolase [Cyanobacteria bacterium RUI128]|nr:alpha/beta hydrolase [Cyanobacteria bacterium RUI128]